MDALYKLRRPLPPQPLKDHRRLKLPLSVLSAVAIVLFFQFSVISKFLSRPSASSVELSNFRTIQLNAILEKCSQYHAPPVRYQFPISSTRLNPRWTTLSGQNESVLLQNATLFDGDAFLPEPVDILFQKGVIKSIVPTSQSKLRSSSGSEINVIQMGGRYVTPGLVDMHSHHTVESWPLLSATSDSNEMNPATGPLTPFVRIVDSIKPYDVATKIIASGGITSSLILPGSANIMGGEGIMIKNMLLSGKDREEVVEDLLLEAGISHSDRRRYMKMACGENPRRVYKHTRMGNAFILRKHMTRAKEILEKQDARCISAAAVRDSKDPTSIAEFLKSESDTIGLPEELEMDSTVGMLRGKVGVNIHCYEPEDFEDMIKHSKEFDFRIQAFHHAISAWKVPEMLKDSEENITIATFSTFGLYKQEAYQANLWAGKILAHHGIPVAFKSDHVEEELNAKYLMFQAATAHSFHLSEELALRSVTSVPAQSLEIDHRVGYIKPGYDADIVVWNVHPLNVGATPLQVFIDGRPVLDSKEVSGTLSNMKLDTQRERERGKLNMRAVLDPVVKEQICGETRPGNGRTVIITGIKASFLETTPTPYSAHGNLTLVINNGKLECFGNHTTCVTASTVGKIIKLDKGYVLPGLTALSTHLGLAEIDMAEETSDGSFGKKSDSLNADNVVFAKYGVHLDGRAFKRARFGGVTKAVTAPMMDGGLGGGVSVGIKTSGKKTILNGGVYKDDVALHFMIGQNSKGSDSVPTVSTAIEKFRKILFENKGKEGVYGSAANGSIPVAVHVHSKYDILQLIKIKKDHGSLNLVIIGGAGAPSVAEELASAQIPVILAPFRSAPDYWEKLDAFVGPPLTKSSAQVLSDAGVKFGLATGGSGDSHIFNLPIEASWAAKYAGLSEHAAVNLVSRNIEAILGIEVREEERDIVVFEGNPLEFGASVVLSVDGDDRSVMDCWPESD